MELAKIDVRDGAKIDMPQSLNLGSQNTKSLTAREGISLEYDATNGWVHVVILSPGADREYFIPREAIALMYPAKRKAAALLKAAK